MGEKGRQNRFNGAEWFERQVEQRTRKVLIARGITASMRSREYQAEYKRQLILFRAERSEKKQCKHEKYLERMEKRLSAEHIRA